MMITQYRSLILENHFGLMHRRLHCQHLHWWRHLMLVGSRNWASVASSHYGAAPNPHRNQHRALQSRIYSHVTSYYSYPTSHISVWSPKEGYIWEPRRYLQVSPSSGLDVQVHQRPNLHTRNSFWLSSSVQAL